jgi:hypothetical protein
MESLQAKFKSEQEKIAAEWERLKRLPPGQHPMSFPSRASELLWFAVENDLLKKPDEL